MAKVVHDTSKLLTEVKAFLDRDNPSGALELLRQAKPEAPTLQNACAVCLMRLGQPEKAVNILRSLLLKGSSLSLSPDAPVVYKANYALALLLSHQFEGCQDVLKEIGDDEHPVVTKARSAVTRWKRSLSLVKRFLLFCGVQSNGHPVALDFPPGDL